MGVELLYNSVKMEVKVFAVKLETEVDEMWYGKPHPAEGALENPDELWGLEKMLIRCSKESQHPAEWTPGPPVEHQENEKDTTLTAISLGSKYFSSVRSPTLSHTQTLSNPFRTLAIKWGVNIFVKKSSCVCLIIASLWYDTWEYNTRRIALALNNQRRLISH